MERKIVIWTLLSIVILLFVGVLSWALFTGRLGLFASSNVTIDLRISNDQDIVSQGEDVNYTINLLNKSRIVINSPSLVVSFTQMTDNVGSTVSLPQILKPSQSYSTKIARTVKEDASTNDTAVAVATLYGKAGKAKERTQLAQASDTDPVLAGAIIKLKKGYNLVSIPYDLSPAKASKVLEGLSVKWAWHWDSSKKKWLDLFGEESVDLTPGLVFWLYTDKETEKYNLRKHTAVLSTPASAVTLKLIGKDSWNQLGNPFAQKISLSQVKIKLDGKLISYGEAVEKKLISKFYIFNKKTDSYLAIEPNGFLESWAGFWVKSGGVFDLTFLFPS